jgi:hypothetical protein
VAVRGFWREFDAFGEFLNGLVAMAAEQLENVPQVDVRRSVVRIQFDGFFDFGAGFVDPACLGQDTSQVVVRLRAAVVEAESFLVLLDASSTFPVAARATPRLL